MFDLSRFTKDAQRVIEIVAHDMVTVKTGRAKPSLVEGVMVEAYGTRMKLMEIAHITAPDTTLIVIKPWDKGNLPAIEKAILSAGLNLQPVVDGEQIRISIPSLTQERREEMVRLVKQKLETGKQMLRDVRIKHKKYADEQKGKPGVSEDDIADNLEQLQKEMDIFTTKLDTMAAEKEVELMSM